MDGWMDELMIHRWNVYQCVYMDFVRKSVQEIGSAGWFPAEFLPIQNQEFTGTPSPSLITPNPDRSWGKNSIYLTPFPSLFVFSLLVSLCLSYAPKSG